MPPMRGAFVFVPSGSKIEAEPPPGMEFAAWNVEPDFDGPTRPADMAAEDCTHIGPKRTE